MLLLRLAAAGGLGLLLLRRAALCARAALWASPPRAALVCLALALRLLVAAWPHSGAGAAPMFGDLEAQRHWMELTAALPVRAWYVAGPDNDLDYWGLDYPPLSAYHMRACAAAAPRVLGERQSAEMLALHASRGAEGPATRAFLRATVLVSDALVYFSGAALVAWALQPARAVLPSLLAHPALVLIDHGHFQYNSVCLGLELLALFCWLRCEHGGGGGGGGRRPHPHPHPRRRRLLLLALGAVFFSLALNYKHIALFHAPVAFFFVLGVCWEHDVRRAGALRRFAGSVALVGAAVVVTFAAVWLPFLGSAADARAVVGRLFPFGRGIFEDRVANFWSSTDPLFHWKTLIAVPTAARLCALVSALGAAAASVPLLADRRPEALATALATCALSCFFFGFQVHEKAILFATLPVHILYETQPLAAAWFTSVALFSMFPLLSYDRLTLPYAALQLVSLTAVWTHARAHHQFGRAAFVAAASSSFTGMAVLHLLCALVSPPPDLPSLFALLITAFCFMHFVCFYAYWLARQWAPLLPRVRLLLRGRSATGRRKRSARVRRPRSPGGDAAE